VPPLGESRAAAWRMVNVDALRNLRYDSFAITRGRHRRLRYTTMSGRIDVIELLLFMGLLLLSEDSVVSEPIVMKLFKYINENILHQATGFLMYTLIN